MSSSSTSFSLIGDDTKRFQRVRLYRVLCVLWVGYAAFVMSRRPVSVARATIQEDIHLSAMETSIVDMAFLFAYTIGQMNYGSIKGNRSSKRVLLIGLVGAAVACALSSMSSNAVMLSLAWAINGIAQATGWASCMSLITPWVPIAARGEILGLWSTNMAAGGIVGNVIPSYLIGHGFSWRTSLLVNTCLLLAVFLLLYFFLVPHPNVVGLVSPQQSALGFTASSIFNDSNAARTVEGEIIVHDPLNVVVVDISPEAAKRDGGGGGGKTSAAPSSETHLTFLSALRVPGVPFIALTYFIHKLVRYTLMLWLPYYLTKEIAFSTETAGYVSSAFDAGGVAGTLLSGFAADFLFNGKRRALVSQIFAVGIAIAVVATNALTHLLSGQAILCSILIGSMGFCAFAVDALLSGVVLLDYCDSMNIPSHQTGAVVGAVGGIGAAGSIFQGLITIAISSWSWSVLLYFLAGVTLLSVTFMIPLLRRETSTYMP